MDAAELKVVCDNYEKRLDAFQDIIDRLSGHIDGLRADQICRSHGGHEFIDKGSPGVPYTPCKHCGRRPEETW